MSTTEIEEYAGISGAVQLVAGQIGKYVGGPFGQAYATFLTGQNTWVASASVLAAKVQEGTAKGEDFADFSSKTASLLAGIVLTGTAQPWTLVAAGIAGGALFAWKNREDIIDYGKDVIDGLQKVSLLTGGGDSGSGGEGVGNNGDIDTGYIELPGGIPVVEIGPGRGIDHPYVEVGPITFTPGGGNDSGGGNNDGNFTIGGWGGSSPIKPKNYMPLSSPLTPEHRILEANTLQFTTLQGIEKSVSNDGKISAQLDNLITLMAGMKDSGSAPLSLNPQNLEALQPVYAASLN